MKIGGFEVGPYVVKESGGKKHLLIDCRDCVYSSNIAGDWACRNHVLRIFAEVEADLIVLAEVYERVYNEGQTKMLLEISQLIQRFEVETIWGPQHLGDAKVEGEAAFGVRHDALVTITHELLAIDPIAAYIRCLQELRREKEEFEKRPATQQSPVYFNTLEHVKEELEKTELVRKAKSLLLQLKKTPETSEIYRVFFDAQVKPSFITWYSSRSSSCSVCSNKSREPMKLGLTWASKKTP